MIYICLGSIGCRPPCLRPFAKLDRPHSPILRTQAIREISLYKLQSPTKPSSSQNIPHHRRRNFPGIHLEIYCNTLFYMGFKSKSPLCFSPGASGLSPCCGVPLHCTMRTMQHFLIRTNILSQMIQNGP